MELQQNRNCWSDSKSSEYCSRGLEEYSTQGNLVLLEEVVLRRQTAIRAVLQEQEAQRRQRRDGYQTWFAAGGCDDKIREAYQKETSLNIFNAIRVGDLDSREALAVYAEQQQPHEHEQHDYNHNCQHRPQPRRRSFTAATA